VPFLVVHVRYVFPVGAKKQMRRVYASAYITPMADKQAARDVAHM
jgi:hypothetical protein